MILCKPSIVEIKHREKQLGDAEKKAGYPIHSHDVVIVGAGLTGLRAAIETVNRGLDTAIISRVHPLRPHSVAAQGGINTAPGGDRYRDYLKLNPILVTFLAPKIGILRQQRSQKRCWRRKCLLRKLY